jgi:poly-gamma-glutamate capsule biosynthesis protein CapA/YwtB (metallophosphatase superfamily)
VKLALAGDTMLGRGVAEALQARSPAELFAPEVLEATHEADLFVLNLECCISDRGLPWPDPGKPFFFRAPPCAVEALVQLGVDCVTLANNHALDFGRDALLDTFDHLDAAGIAWVGAGADLAQARRPVVVTAGGFRLGVVGLADHPRDYEAGQDGPGIAFADLHHGVPDWVTDAIASVSADAVLVTPHWGPNMIMSPLRYVRGAAGTLASAGASLVAGHSAHVPQGVEHGIIYDLGDFIDDYTTHPVCRNDLGLLYLVEFDGGTPIRIEALPLKLDYCHTCLAGAGDWALVRRRFVEACAGLGTNVTEDGSRLVIDLTRGRRGRAAGSRSLSR